MASRKRSPHDFLFREELGHGSYSTVYKAIDKRNANKVYAIKVCSKAHIIQESKVKYVTIEKNTLNLLAKAKHPGIVKLYYTFHDQENLYFVLDFAAGGELLSLLHKYTKFNEVWARHFTVQLIDTLQYIHSQGVIHRDLKPENVLLDKEGRLMITDFGAAATFNSEQDSKGVSGSSSTSSFVGTAEYVSPELLLYNQCGFGSDVWALGCMIFQFIEGHPPFRGENELKTFEKIVALDYTWNSNNNSTTAVNTKSNPIIVNLVRRILTLDTKSRMSLKEIQLDVWFQNVDWNDKAEIWKGIWQIQQTYNNYPLSYSYQHNMPNRHLHVIDIPLKNIAITKQKKKKPMKAANTTNSIVEWRKKLGISNGPKQNMFTPPILLDTMATPVSNMKNVPQQNNVNNIPASNNGNTTVPAPSNYIQPPLNTTVTSHSRSVPSLFPLTPNFPKQNSIITPQPIQREAVLQQTNNQLAHTFPIESISNDNIIGNTINDGQFAQNQVISTKIEAIVPPKKILKQDFIYMHAIPYKVNGPKMSMQSYNLIDNELITSLVTQNKSALKSSAKIPKLLTLSEDGYLSYYDDFAGSEKCDMVNIGDSDLSMYDFEFDEVTRKGYLILEKYKYMIWFISLPSFSAISSLSPSPHVATTTSVNSVVVNIAENWVDCFFRARQLLDEKELLDKMGRISISAESGQVSGTTPTSYNPSPTTTSFTSSEPSPINDLHIPNKYINASHKQNSFLVPTDAVTQKMSKNDNARNKRLQVPGPFPQTTPAGTKTQIGLASQENRRIASDAINASNYGRITTSPILNGREQRSGVPSPKIPNRTTSTASPGAPFKKYNVPKNLVVSSSRYEVIHALNGFSNFEQSAASSGASAAFKNLQRQKESSNRSNNTRRSSATQK
ncbi:hypothetical protein KAFR_0K02490 [Kazachstania africana CBS 2517]|uniref:non-specific serine/threonine protein kinase n=1 Tax=Kazachstania africana (strain ATCC 22294 / BCRC 22015 / CBS 2517 / CECT 1963 / NBRC 1671 / NRRL Y-8276) TaxID=1071382 RepID=H2B1V5_KAZAF|nr:hypothetical protein KAFR_0K02490 [Kazachstania africana CBS 2517]CCF60605.1 hypothetical protein KAFR_0K02490 [Kazachstania africana CBS 2517]